MSKFCGHIHHKVYHLRMCPRIGRLCLWPFALCAAFPHALGGRYATDYYGQSVPSVPVAPQERLPLRGWPDGSSVAVWLRGNCVSHSNGVGLASEHVLSDRELEGRVLRICRCSNLPNLCSSLPANIRSTGYSPPGISDRICQPRLGHVSSSPITG